MTPIECRECKWLGQNIKRDMFVNEVGLTFSETGKQFTDSESLETLSSTAALAGRGFFNISNKKGLLQSIATFFGLILYVLYTDKEEIMQSPKRQRGILLGIGLYMFFVIGFYLRKKYQVKKGEEYGKQGTKNSFKIDKVEISNVVFKKKDRLYNIGIGPSGGGSIKMIKKDGSSHKYYITGKDQLEVVGKLLSESGYISK